MEGLQRFCGGTDRPAFWRLAVDATAMDPPPQNHLPKLRLGSSAKRPLRGWSCGLTTENRAVLLVDGGRDGAGLSRVGLHPDCGFHDPGASRWTRVPDPSKGS